MKITRLDTWSVSVPYRHTEVSSRVFRGGVTDVIVKLTADNGLVGWGESCSGANAESIQEAVLSARPFVIGADPWQRDAIAREFFSTGLWDHRVMTGNFAFAGIDQALWDLCGKECGQPIYRLLGGAQRDTVNYFYYLSQGEPADIVAQCHDGLDRGYSCFYLKVGVNAESETEMLRALRATVGEHGKIRIDANQAWSVREAASLLNRWDEEFVIDFVEAPVAIDPIENMVRLRHRTNVSFCANEGLWRDADALRIIQSGCADVLCFSSYWVGTLRSFHTLSHTAGLLGQQVCKHTHGELGLAAAAGHHVMLSTAHITDGIQQTAAMMEDDILVEPLPIATGPEWGLLSEPGLGVIVDEDKVARYHEHYREHGQYLPYRV